jgi:hypothetical protein
MANSSDFFLDCGTYAKHRDAKLAEALTSFFFFRNGFQILDYDPPGADGNEGDLTIQWRTSTRIFVEIKNPSWLGELLPRTKGEQDRLTKQQWRQVTPCKLPHEVATGFKRNTQQRRAKRRRRT